MQNSEVRVNSYVPAASQRFSSHHSREAPRQVSDRLNRTIGRLDYFTDKLCRAGEGGVIQSLLIQLLRMLCCHSLLRDQHFLLTKMKEFQRLVKPVKRIPTTFILDGLQT